MSTRHFTKQKKKRGTNAKRGERKATQIRRGRCNCFHSQLVARNKCRKRRRRRPRRRRVACAPAPCLYTSTGGGRPADRQRQELALSRISQRNSLAGARFNHSQKESNKAAQKEKRERKQSRGEGRRGEPERKQGVQRVNERNFIIALN